MGSRIAFFKLPNPKRISQVAQDIHEHRRFTDVFGFPPRNWKRGELCLALIGTRKDCITHAAIAKRGREVAKKKHHIRFLRVETFSEPVKIPWLRKHLRKSQQDWPSTFDGFPFLPKLWKVVIKTLRQRRPDVATSLDDLLETLKGSQEKLSDHEARILGAERDAVGLVLDIGRMDRAKVLESALPRKVEGRFSNFLNSLESTHQIESEMIFHDCYAFLEGWDPRPVQAGGAVFRQGDREIYMFNANQNELENTLGVDLIWMDSRFDSFLMVQYKVLENGRYYPKADPSYSKEMDRIRYTQSRLDDQERGLYLDRTVHDRDFRLSSSPFFFKMCERFSQAPMSSDMVQGFFIPLGHWQAIMRSKLGERGASMIDRNKLSKWLSNTEFVALAQKGYIGSASLHAEILWDLVKHGLTNRRSVMTACHIIGD